MIKRLFLIAALGVTVSGCFMAPMAFVGPAASGFSTASIVQSGITTSANYMIKKSTGKTIAEHALQSLNKDVYHQTFFPKIKAANQKSSIRAHITK
tara:strand:- start:381 stop:668 length:288 start_codon:yes stop_codon:yes gene_type:complete